MWQTAFNFIQPHHVLSHVHCATPIYSAVLLILRDLFVPFFATEEDPFGAETFCQVKLSTTCLTLKNQQIPVPHLIYLLAPHNTSYHHNTHVSPHTTRPLPSPSPPLPSPPSAEILLCLAWLVLLLLGVVLQSVLSCRRPPFPTKSLYRRCREKRTGRERAEQGLNGFTASTRETSPLLGYDRSSRKHRKLT